MPEYRSSVVINFIIRAIIGFTLIFFGRIGGPGGRDSLLCKKADGAVLARPSDHGF